MNVICIVVMDRGVQLFADSVFFTVHNTRDENSFGRHINLHLTYSFQQQNNSKTSLFGQPGELEVMQFKYMDTK